jgi:hypothetical protein
MMRRTVASLLAVSASVALVGGPWARLAEASDKGRRPSVSIRATPAVAFSPARIYLTAELKGGADDYAEYYCPTIQWDWGDGTQSESRADCDPYEAGESEIKRRYIAEHTFRYGGSYRVTFRLKQANKVVGSSQTNVQVRPGARDMMGMD